MANLNTQAVNFTQNKNRQKSSYYTPPFWKAPRIPHLAVEAGSEFQRDVDALKRQNIDVLDAYVEVGDLVVWVKPSAIYATLECLKNQRKYETLSEMSAMDYLEQKGGFELFYQLLCYERKMRMRVRAFITEDERIESVTPLFKAADWSEREMYDMFGIIVNNHPNFKRILMPDDWHGYPLRKSYPLHGDEAAQWYEVDKIFGKEYREIVGPENRDPARIDRHDTLHFAHLGYEVPYGADNTQEEAYPITYQEESGVSLVRRLKLENSKELKERK